MYQQLLINQSKEMDTIATALKHKATKVYNAATKLEYHVQQGTSNLPQSNYETVLVTSDWKKAYQEYKRIAQFRASRKRRVVVETFVNKPVLVKREILR